MEFAQALKFTYTSVAQEIVCDTDVMAGLCDTLDRLGATTCHDRLWSLHSTQEEGLEAIAAATLHDRALATNPRPITGAESILQVLREAW